MDGAYGRAVCRETYSGAQEGHRVKAIEAEEELTEKSIYSIFT